MKRKLEPVERQRIFLVVMYIVVFIAIALPLTIYFVQESQPHYSVGGDSYAMSEWNCSLLDVSHGEELAVQCENTNGDVSVLQTNTFEIKNGDK